MFGAICALFKQINKNNTILIQGMYYKGNTMNIKVLRAALAGLVLSVSVFANAGLIISDSDIALTGAITDDFSSYAIGDTLIVSDGVFSLSEIGGGTLSVTDGFNGSYGAIGRSVVSWAGLGVTLDFSNTVSAFGIHIGGSDQNWKVEAFDINNVSLGFSTVAHDVEGFYLGWSGLNIKSIAFTPTSNDAVLFDNLSYVPSTQVPEPSTLAIFALGMIGLASRRFKKQ